MWLFYIFRFAQLQNILQKIRFAHLAKFFASNSLRSFGKNFCKQFASLIWQKESLYRANFATFASLNICKIILNVRSAHYLQINLCTLAMLAHKLGPSLGFFGCLTLFYFGLLWQVGCRYTYYCHLSSSIVCFLNNHFIEDRFLAFAVYFQESHLSGNAD